MKRFDENLTTLLSLAVYIPVATVYSSFQIAIFDDSSDLGTRFLMLSGSILLYCNIVTGICIFGDRYKSFATAENKRYKLNENIRNAYDSCFLIFGVLACGLQLISFAVPNHGAPIPACETTILCMAPLLFRMLCACTVFYTKVVSWLVCVASLLLAISLSGSWDMIPALVVVSSVGLVMCARRLTLSNFIDETHKSRESLDVMLADMIACFSHDLMSPIQAMEMGLEVLATENMSESQRMTFSNDTTWLNTVRGLQETLSSISYKTDRHLDATRIVASIPLVPNLVFFDMKDEIDRLIRSVNYVHDTAIIDITQYPPLLNYQDICTDRGWFRANMIGMLVNAVEVSRKDIPVEISISISSILDVTYITVEVTDSFENATDDLRDTFFEKFNRSKRKKVGGVGLGLYVMEKRVEALGGTVGSHERADRRCNGSCVWFKIPIEITSYEDSIDESMGRKGVSVNGGRDSLRGSGHAMNNARVSTKASRRDRGNSDLGVPAASSIHSKGTKLSHPSARHAISVSPAIENPAVVASSGSGVILRSEPREQPSGEAAVIDLAIHVPLSGFEMRVSNPNTPPPGIQAQPSPKVAKVWSRLFEYAPTPRPNNARIADISSRPSSHSQALTFLVADDAVPIVKICTAELTRAGHTVENAFNGREAMALMLEKTYDVVLMDITMPVMGGIECVLAFRRKETEFIRSGSRKYRQFIVGMSVTVTDELRARALSGGMQALLAKPFRMHTLAAMKEQYRLSQLQKTVPTIFSTDVSTGVSRTIVPDFLGSAKSDNNRKRSRAGGCSLSPKLRSGVDLSPMADNKMSDSPSSPLPTTSLDLGLLDGPGVPPQEVSDLFDRRLIRRSSFGAIPEGVEELYRQSVPLERAHGEVLDLAAPHRDSPFVDGSVIPTRVASAGASYFFEKNSPISSSSMAKCRSTGQLSSSVKSTSIPRSVMSVLHVSSPTTKALQKVHPSTQL